MQVDTAVVVDEDEQRQKRRARELATKQAEEEAARDFLRRLGRTPFVGVGTDGLQVSHGLQLQSLWRIPAAAVSSHVFGRAAGLALVLLGQACI